MGWPLGGQDDDDPGGAAPGDQVAGSAANSCAGLVPTVAEK